MVGQGSRCPHSAPPSAIGFNAPDGDLSKPRLTLERYNHLKEIAASSRSRIIYTEGIIGNTIPIAIVLFVLLYPVRLLYYLLRWAIKTIRQPLNPQTNQPT